MKKRAVRLKKPLIALTIFILLIILYFMVFLLPKERNNFECQSDNDCVKVQTTCCSCSMGGNEVCASKNQAENLTAKNCPVDLMCIALYNCKIESCACMKGKCEGIPLE